MTRIFTPGAAHKISAFNSAAASKCSKLSNIRSSSFSRSHFKSSTCIFSLPRLVRPSVSATARINRSLEVTPASGTKKSPSRYCSHSAAARTASLVLPIPPGPTRVISRQAGSPNRTASWVSSSSRPMKGVAWGGSLRGDVDRSERFPSALARIIS